MVNESKKPEAGLFGGSPVREPEGPFGSFARYLAWVFLVLVLGLAIFLSFMIGQNARDVLLQKQYAFAHLLADNLNHQIYRRYTLPTLVGFGRIALRQPAQYERLDQLIEQVIHGMNVQQLSIYDPNNIVSYSTDIERLGRDDLASPAVGEALYATEPIFNLDMERSFWKAFFMPNLEKGSVILRTTYPLRVEGSLSSPQGEAPVMGILEFTQDITSDIQNVLRFQWSIIGITLVSCLMIFSIMIMFLQRAEKALAARVAEKERLQERLYQHEKLAGMGRVIAGIAHEIRNPLGIICSSAEFLLRRGKDMDESSRGILQATYDEAHRLSRTVTDFLDYARPQTPRQDVVDVAQVLNQAVAFMKPELDRHGIALEIDLNGLDGAKALGDKELLYRAVYNILGNAVQSVSQKYAEKPELGRIWLDVQGAGKGSPDGQQDGDSDGLYAQTNGAGKERNAEPELCISIRDNGGGFELEDLSTYLDPFFTTRKGGSGLGLAIVNSIISSHNGRLELANATEETGAIVRIILPLIK